MTQKFNFQLPDFKPMIRDVLEEVKLRVERRTPRSNDDPKTHAQDQWEIIQTDKGGMLTNSAPYINFLENGTSKMAGVHMVALTLEEVPDIISKAYENATK